MGNLGREPTLNIQCSNSGEKKPFRTSNPPKWRMPGIHRWFNRGLLGEYL